MNKLRGLLAEPNPYFVLAVAVILPGMGHVLVGQPKTWLHHADVHDPDGDDHLAFDDASAKPSRPARGRPLCLRGVHSRGLSTGEATTGRCGSDIGYGISKGIRASELFQIRVDASCGRSDVPRRIFRKSRQAPKILTPSLTKTARSSTKTAVLREANYLYGLQT